MSVVAATGLYVCVLACGDSDSVIVDVAGEPDTLLVGMQVDGSTLVVFVDSLRLEVGQTAQLSATTRNVLGLESIPTNVTWSSADEGVATVSDSGIITAVALGRTSISVVTPAFTVTVPTSVVISAPDGDDSGGTVVPTTIRLTPVSSVLQLGDSVRFSATVLDSAGLGITGATVVWSSEDSTIASVSTSGLVRSARIGVTSIRAEYGTLLAAASLTVIPAPSTVGLAFEDDFDNGRLSSTSEFSWGALNATGGKRQVVSDQSYSGAYSLRMRYGPDAPGGDSNNEMRFVIPSRPTEVWIEYMLRVPDNFEHRSGGANNNKLLALWAENYGSPTTTLHLVWEFTRDSDASSRIRVASAKADGYERTGQEDSQDLIRDLVFTPEDIGNWIRLRFHVRSAVDASIMDVWRNDRLISRMPAAYSVTAPGWDEDYIGHGFLMGWSNSGYSEQTDFFIDDFRLYTTDPGW
jgi:hypothetical protein